MELEFDKEIDSLLRKADRGVLAGETPGETLQAHLDADEFAAFAENAMPERVRAVHMEHLADCGNCRKILSGLIALNADAEPVEDRIAAPSVVPVTAVVPWYRRLLLPNLAYVMGGLVLIFGGLITISLLRSSTGNELISQSVSNTAAPARGPMEADVLDQVAVMPTNTNANLASGDRPVMSANAANTQAFANSATANTAGKPLDERNVAPAAEPSGAAVDGVDAAKPAAAAPVPAPPPPAKAEELLVKDDDRARLEAKAKRDDRGEREDADLAAKQRSPEVPSSQAGGVAKATPGPSREAQQNFPNRAGRTYELYEEKRIGSRTFQRRDNVWYDRAYRGQATVNIRRNTDEYRKLDAGLRTIAESLSGVVVVVWDSKAYRFQ